MGKGINRVRLYTDGGARGNPGPGGIGVMILDPDDNELEKYGEYIGSPYTNNQVEYRALIKGLELSAKHTEGRVSCFLDSELVVKQMRGEYQINNPELRSLFGEVKRREKAFKEVRYKHLRRNHPKIYEVDQLVNEALDRGRREYKKLRW